MSTHDRLQAAADRWQNLTPHNQAMATATLIGTLLGRSYSSDAISMVGLVDVFEGAVLAEEYKLGAERKQRAEGAQ